MADDLGERTEAPTARRRREARDRGQVARSQDLGAAVDIVGGFVLLLALGTPLCAGLSGMLRFLLDDRESGRLPSVGGVGDLLRWAAVHAAVLLGPMVLILFAVGVLAQVLQVGWHVSGEAIGLRLDKLNPVAGFQRLFGLRGVVKTGLGLAKLVVVGALVAALVAGEWRSIAGLATLRAHALWAATIAILTRIIAWVAVVLAILGVADYLYQRWRHTGDLRMTKQQVKEEHKTMEGDPEIKGRRLRVARQIALQRLRQSVPKADVIVTNPTHFAVALRYDAATMAAPKVVAKGADLMAFRIREIAAAHGVPIVERPPLARALYAGVPVGRTIRPEFYEAVAEILAFVYRLNGRAA
jgi:flagellar biosynthetic protein FlhB